MIGSVYYMDCMINISFKPGWNEFEDQVNMR